MRGPALCVCLLPAACAMGEAPSDGAGSCTGCAPGLVCQDDRCLVPAGLAVTSHGGPVLVRSDVWTVVWQGDERLGATLDAVTQSVVASSYFSDNLAEYGVGPGASHGVIALGPPPAAVDRTIFDEAIGQIVGRTSSAGETLDGFDDQTLVAFLIPTGTSEPVGTSYHSETAVTFASDRGGSLHVPYIVVRQDDPGFVPAFDYLTWSLSHELVEAATDPHPGTAVAWLSQPLALEGEIADLCSDTLVRLTLDGSEYAVTRMYSALRASARLGDPCVPALDTPFESIAVSPVEIVVPRSSGHTTIRLSGYTLGTTDPMGWQLLVEDGYAVAPDSGTLAPGDEVEVTVTRTGSPADPVLLLLWVTSPSSPRASIPRAETFAAIRTGP